MDIPVVGLTEMLAEYLVEDDKGEGVMSTISNDNQFRDALNRLTLAQQRSRCALRRKCSESQQ